MISSLLLSASLLAFPQGATVYVPDDYNSIQIAINAVVAGDTVVVRPGTYSEYEISFGGKSITLLAEMGPTQTTIDGTGAGSVFTFNGAESADAILDGFSITNGSAWDGGGISITADSSGAPSSPTINNCVIEFNEGVGGGGGLALGGGSLSVISNCLIQDNFTSNYHGAGVVIFSSEPLFKNCTIRNNTSAGSGGGFAVWDTATIVTIRNCILTGNFPTNIDKIGAPTVRARYSCLEGDSAQEWFGTGCIDADPMFVSGPLGDAYLSHIAAGQTADSPCIDAGKPTIDPYLSTRTDHGWDVGIVDMGYHYRDPNNVTLSTTGVPGGPMTFDVAGGTATGPLVYLYAFGTGSYQATNPYTGNVVVTGLSAFHLTVADVVAANASGGYSYSATVPAAAAGVVFVQVLDGFTDRFSNVVGL